MDLLNYNSIISKIGAYKELFIPMGRTGDRGIEFDILSGQDVQLNTDLMEMLRTNMLNTTGVPSVIMNYVNEVDFAKTLAMANSKFVGRVISLQIDCNTGTTELYKKIMKFSNVSIPEDIIEKFVFKFNSPKTLNTMNMTDMINNADQVAAAAIKTITGENSDPDADANKLKDKLYNKIMRDLLPMLNWQSFDKAYEESKLELAKEKLAPKPKSTEDYE